MSSIGTKLDKLQFEARKNKWLGYFAVFCRIALAAGFIPSGMQKVLGERFTVLAVEHPMGNFLEAFHHTGYYYTFVGVFQVLAGILLLIPRTATLGAVIYFPIILNICILSFAVRFDGSLVSSPLMLCAVLYLLCWDYHKFRNIFPFNHTTAKAELPQESERTKKFPVKFFAGVVVVTTLIIVHTNIYQILPRNTLKDCQAQCEDAHSVTCMEFCACIHTNGTPLESCLDDYESTN